MTHKKRFFLWHATEAICETHIFHQNFASKLFLFLRRLLENKWLPTIENGPFHVRLRERIEHAHGNISYRRSKNHANMRHHHHLLKLQLKSSYKQTNWTMMYPLKTEIVSSKQPHCFSKSKECSPEM